MQFLPKSIKNLAVCSPLILIGSLNCQPLSDSFADQDNAAYLPDNIEMQIMVDGEAISVGGILSNESEQANPSSPVEKQIIQSLVALVASNKFTAESSDADSITQFTAGQIRYNDGMFKVRCTSDAEPVSNISKLALRNPIDLETLNTAYAQKRVLASAPQLETASALSLQATGKEVLMGECNDDDRQTDDGTQRFSLSLNANEECMCSGKIVDGVCVAIECPHGTYSLENDMCESSESIIPVGGINPGGNIEVPDEPGETGGGEGEGGEPEEEQPVVKRLSGSAAIAVIKSLIESVALQLPENSTPERLAASKLRTETANAISAATSLPEINALAEKNTTLVCMGRTQ